MNYSKFAMLTLIYECMKRICVLLTVLAVAVAAGAREYDVLDFGAVADGSTLVTSEIQKAIDACHDAGGGRVTVPAGDYVVGTLNLKSNVEFHFEHGARLIATMDLSQYQRHNEQLAGVFYTDGQDNVSITGKGVVFGNGMGFMYRDTPKKIGLHERLRTRQGEGFRAVPEGIGDGPLEPKDRFHQMIVFTECTNLTLTDFLCKDSPFWCFLIVHCRQVTLDGLVIDNNLLIPNSDGVDVISSSDVNISNCVFKCGDDALVLAGYGWHQGDPGFKNLSTPSARINVSNCILQSRSSGIRIGGHDQNPMHDFNFSNITIYDSNRGINISVSDSCSLENVTFNNIRIDTRLHTGDWWGQGEPINITAMQLDPAKPDIGVIRNLFFNNITSVGENSVVMIADSQTRLENIFFNNFEFVVRRSAIEDVAGGNYDLRLNCHEDRQLYPADEPVFYIENARNVMFTNGVIGWDGADMPYHTHAIDALDVDGLAIRNVKASPAPSNKKLKAVRTRNCSNVKIVK